MQRSLSLLVLLAAAVKSAAPPAVVIDGDPGDPVWRSAATVKLASAAAGIPAGLGGELRLAVAGRYLYVSARLPEPDGRVTARSFGRNPHWEEEDVVRVVVGRYPDFVVQVGPLGAWSVETKGQPIAAPNFFAAARMGEREWTAEIAVPLNDLKATRLDEVRMTVERVRAMRPGTAEEHWRWPADQPAGKIPAPGPDAPDPVFRPAPAGNREAPLTAGRGSGIPALDAAWDDPAWRDVPGWKLLRNQPLAIPPLHATSVKVLHDTRRLAVLAECREPAGSGESFDLYLATSGSAYVRYSLTSAGGLQQFTGMAGGQYISRPRTDWTSSARALARRGANAWTARIDVPLDEVATVLGEVNTPREWRVLFARARPATAGEPRETSVLPVTQSETLLSPARYRRLSLTEKGQPIPDRQAETLVDTRVLSPALREQMAPAGMLSRQMRDRALRILEKERQDWDRVQTVADWERFRDPRLQSLARWMGGFPARAPLQLRVTKEYPGEAYRRQDVLYQTRPGLWTTANLYLPAKPAGRMPGIVLVHSQHRPRTQAELQDMGILWARSGAAVLIPDVIGAGERLQNYPWNREAYHSRYIMGMQLYLVGESLIKWMVWDIMRSVDLLLQRPDIDRQQIILIGAVAGGGDPAAVAAALDPRISAVVPFNFGEASPENTRSIPEKNRWPLNLADPGWGGWETTRSLPRSIADQFLPWLICVSVAPRRFVYAFEMGWKVEEMPAWARYQKVYGLYNAKQNLSEAHGFGPFPGPGECTNIGPAQRKLLYPAFERWFGIAPPLAEPKDRRPENELDALTPAIAAALHGKMVHEMASDIGKVQLNSARAQLAGLDPKAQREWLRSKWAARLGEIEPNRRAPAVVQWKKAISGGEAEGITLETEQGIVLPLLLLKPAGSGRAPVVVALAEPGKEALLAVRSREIEALLRQGKAVCLPDVRGTGETAPDSRRGPLSAGISLAAAELMMGNTLLGAQLKDLRSVLAYIESRPDLDREHIALWGETLVPPNPARMVDELPNWQIGPQIQQQAEPLGGLLALLGTLYEDSVRAIAVEGGLASFASILEDRFAYVPSDIIVPGILAAGDLNDVAKALAPRPVLLENLRDGRNRVVGRTIEAPQPVQWLAAHM